MNTAGSSNKKSIVGTNTESWKKNTACVWVSDNYEWHTRIHFLRFQRMKFIRDNFRDLPGLRRCFDLISHGRSCVPRPFGRHDQEYIEYLRYFKRLRDAESRASGKEIREWGSMEALRQELKPNGELYRVLEQWSKFPLTKDIVPFKTMKTRH